MSAAPEEILSYGLIDRVSLARVHTDVLENDADAPLSHVQKQVLSLVRSLVGDELFEVGDLSLEFRSLISVARVNFGAFVS